MKSVINMKNTSNLKVANNIWLMYFNEVLFQAELITEKERNRMAIKIKDNE